LLAIGCVAVVNVATRLFQLEPGLGIGDRFAIHREQARSYIYSGAVARHCPKKPKRAYLVRLITPLCRAVAQLKPPARITDSC
jgi:hypothetical protein